MTSYRILFWQEVPTQIKADDGIDEVTLPLSPRFLERVDQLAVQRGLQQADDYLAQWKWSEDEEREGSAQEVAAAVRAEMEAKWGML